MRRIALCFVFIILFSNISLAAVRVDDPKNILPNLDTALGSASWEQSFRQGDQAKYLKLEKECRIDCNEEGFFQGCSILCQEIQEPYSRTVASCDANSLKIFSDDGEIFEISHEEFDSFRGNLARPYLAQLEEVIPDLDRIELEQVQPTQYKLGAGTPKERSVSAFNLMGSMYLKAHSKLQIKFLITVGKDVAGVGQIMRLRVLETSLFRLLDINLSARK